MLLRISPRTRSALLVCPTGTHLPSVGPGRAARDWRPGSGRAFPGSGRAAVQRRARSEHRVRRLGRGGPGEKGTNDRVGA